MKLSVNLRSDLAKVSDAELAERLERAWHEVDAAETRSKWWTLPGLLWARRGPIRHPRAYRFLAALQGATGGNWLDMAFAAALSDKKLERFIKCDRVTAVHLNLCEIRDIMDELERRLARRQRTKH